MAKDILMYGYIGEYSARDFFEKIAEAQKENEDEELVFRINTDGGNPQFGWGMLAKMNEVDNKKVKVDGAANSMGAFACLYCEDVEAVDTAEFCIHRAAHSYEAYPEYFDDLEQKRLANINSKLKKAFKARVDLEKFEEITGKTIEDIFSMDSRVEVTLTAEEAKQCGFINSVVKLTPKRKQEIAAFKESATVDTKVDGPKDKKAPIKANQEKSNPTQKKDHMTLEELKAQHPALYNAAFEAGEKAGVKKENDRVMAWKAFDAIDAKKVNEGITKGEELTTRHMAEFQATAMSSDYLSKLKKDSAKEVTTEANKDNVDPTLDAKAKEIATFGSEIDAHLGVKPKAA